MRGFGSSISRALFRRGGIDPYGEINTTCRLVFRRALHVSSTKSTTPFLDNRSNSPTSGFNSLWSSLRPVLWTHFAGQRRTMFIQTQSTPNPSSLMFYPGKPVMEVGSADFPNARTAMNSPLAKALYGIDEIFVMILGTGNKFIFAHPFCKTVNH
uniref:Scaffold protein Nfu/NifU N-terminal domain-containing protein n=1 Tax=Manihot esculenta TaxID=3983 RepID=A0A2C9V3Q4_MANES